MALLALLVFWASLRRSSRGLHELLPGEAVNFDAVSHTFELKRGGASVLTGKLGTNFTLEKEFKPSRCSVGDQEVPCIEWDTAKLAILEDNESAGAGTRCHTVYWEARSCGSVPNDCFDIGDNNWYGGPQLWVQRWTIEKHEEKMQQYLSWDNGFNKKGYASVLERYWLSSNGVAVFAHDDCPLHFGISPQKLCLKGDFSNSWYKNDEGNLPTLHYTVCVAGDVRAVHKAMIQKFFAKPTSIPAETVFRYPIWSTWARYKDNVTQKNTLDLAQEIKSHGFRGCQIEIDDGYATKFGDHTFNPRKFPNPPEMIGKLHELGFKVTSWVHPFVNTDAVAFPDGIKNGYFVGNSKGIPALVSWWRGTAGLLDITNPDAVEWFFNRLSHLGLDSFKFDAGESYFLPPNFTTKNPLTNANHYGRQYAEAAHRRIGNNIEVRVGYRSQHLPVFVRMMDKESRWDDERAFATMIPTALQFGIVGYPFVLPDMIGGNAYNDPDHPNQDNLPSKELFIRWLELNAFLPAMQFSIAPWQYDDETVRIAKKWTALHEGVLTDLMLDAARNSVKTGEPIIKPVWWIDPLDKNTFSIEDEFLVGDSLLVAPIIEDGARARDIYLPEGKWKDKLRGKTLMGRQWYRGYSVELDEIAHFEFL